MPYECYFREPGETEPRIARAARKPLRDAGAPELWRRPASRAHYHIQRAVAVALAIALLILLRQVGL